MDWPDVLKIIAVILTIGGTAYSAVRFVLSERQKQSALTEEVRQLKQRLELVSTTLREDIDRFQELQDISSNAEIAIGADIHSISIPVPRESPTHLKIIISTDQKANRIIGKEFPISEGLAGKVYFNQRGEFVNRALDDPNHFKVIDETAGTKTGEGSIISFPLINAGICLGVAQFMKYPGRPPFTKEDLTIVCRFAKKITDRLIKLEEVSKDDPRIGSLPEIFASVLFSDINEYNQVANNISLYQAVNFLDEYYRRMLEVSQNFGAVFEEYIGDGVYLSFQGKTKNETTRSAILCAQEMQSAFETLKREWIAFQYPFSDKNYHNIGIASGYIFEGTVGHSQHRRRKLIGSTINNAAHLAEFGKRYGGCVLIDRITHDLTSTFGVISDLKAKEPECYKISEKTA